MQGKIQALTDKEPLLLTIQGLIPLLSGHTDQGKEQKSLILE
jgi:hypothetical protein